MPAPRWLARANRVGLNPARPAHRPSRLHRDESRKEVPAPVRILLGVISADDFLSLDIAGPAPRHDESR